MAAENNVGVALVKRVCPICGGQQDEILLNRRLSVHAAKQMDELNGKVVGMLDRPCDNCSEYMEKGFLLIGIVAEKSGSMKPEEIYRSGNIWVITKEAAEGILGKHPEGFAFIDEKVAEKMGLPMEN